MRPVLLSFGLCLLLSDAAAAQSLDPEASLWCSDDMGRRIFRVSMDGSFVHSSFHSGSISGLAVDPVDGTLWAAKEGSALVMHFDRLGNELGVIDTTAIDPDATGPEGVTVDAFDNTLWIVDDDSATLYNVARDGSLLTSFSTTMVHPWATSPQAVAADPTDGSLWITENRTDAVYNLTVTGDHLGSFLVEDSLGAMNCQGINVDEADGTLWLTDRDSHTVFHLERDGTLISSFDTAHYGSLNPTGVVYDSFALPHVPGLDRAGDYAVLGANRVKLRGPEPEITGDVALAPGAMQVFDQGLIDGTLFVDPTADNSHDNDVVITGGIVAEDLSLAAADMVAAAEGLADLPATQSFKRIKTTTTIEGGAGLNVIEVGTIALKRDDTLTLTGGPHARFLLNVRHAFRLRGSASLVIAGDVDPTNVTINVVGRRGVRLTGDSSATGNFLAANGGVALNQEAAIHGAVLSTGNVSVFKSARIAFWDTEE